MVRWREGRRSTNVEDRRGAGAPRMGTPARIGGLGGIGILIILAVVLMGGDPSALLEMAGSGSPEPAGAGPPGPVGEDDDAQFVSVMLASTEDVWGELFAAAGATYEAPRLVLFTDAVQSACGFSTAATGPFYCPGDRRVYIDLGFFRELARLGGPGDFARAYVIGHEVGHHIQTLTGISDEIRRRQAAAGGEAGVNALQVRMELQADCLAGVWANRADRRDRILEPGDVEEGLAAAGAIGDDRLARNHGRYASPESFTHGTSAQRREWLARGLQTGDPDACDTLAAG